MILFLVLPMSLSIVTTFSALLSLHDVCISYIYIAVIKYHDQGNLQKELFIWSYSSRGIRVHPDGRYDSKHLTQLE